jgi:hypothetical protein
MKKSIVMKVICARIRPHFADCTRDNKQVHINSLGQPDNQAAFGSAEPYKTRE